MKVLFLSQIVPYPPHGGVLQRGYNLLRELGRHTEVHLMAFVHPDEMSTPRAVEESRAALGAFCASIEYFPLWAKASRAHRLTALGMSALSASPFSMIAHRSAALDQRLRTLLATARFDLVHVDTIGLDPFVRPHRALPSVLTHHNIESMLMARRAAVERSWAARAFLRREAAKLRTHEMTVTRAYDVNVVVSPNDERTLLEMTPGLRTAVVPNGVDVDYFRPEPGRRQTPTLIYTGGMNMFANRDAVLHFTTDIWPRITARVPEVRFLAIGQDPPPELRAQAAVDPRIVVAGFVQDIRPHVDDAAVYVVPLRVGGGTRLKVLDAMAMGKAIVSTTVGSEGIEGEVGTHRLIGDTPEAFADAVVTLLNDEDRRRSLGAAARALAETRYSWGIIGQRLLGAYETAIAARSSRAAGK
ncbi:MAG: glycosyltransferase [Acidobacteria bacterium]|nr:glycosyltransferase [Acidobacteriota bacterium]